MDNKELENKVEELEELTENDMEDVSGGITNIRKVDNNENEAAGQRYRELRQKEKIVRGEAGPKGWKIARKKKTAASKSVRGAESKGRRAF